MDFLSNLAKGGASDKSGDDNSSKADILANAKIVAEAAQAQFSGEPEKSEKTKAGAAAAADIIDSASEYGKLDETKGVGKYVDQAEDYLRKYGTPHSAGAPPPASGEHKPAPTTTAEAPSGGAGDYVKKAEEFLKKPSEGGEKSDSESGFGGMLKGASGFLNK